MEEQHAPAEPVGPDLEARAVGRERVAPGRPRPVGIGHRRVVVVVAVVEHDLEQPVRRLLGHAVRVADALEVALRVAPRAHARGFVRDGRVDAARVFRDVLVGHHLAAVVAGLLEQPGEDALRMVGVGDPRGRAAPEHRGLVVGGDRAPVRDPVAPVGPALRAGVAGLDAWAEVLDHIGPPALFGGAPRAGRDQLLPRQVVSVVARVGGQRPRRPAGHGRDRQRPAGTEHAVAAARVVAELERRRRALAPRGERQRERDRRGPGRRAHRDALVDPADRAAAARRLDRRAGGGLAGTCRLVAGCPAGERSVHAVPRPSQRRRAKSTR